MALTVADIRQRVATRMEAVAGWTESNTVGGPQWQGVGIPDPEQVRTFAVTCPTTTGNATGNQSDGQIAPSRGDVTVRTVVRVDWRANIRADNQVADYDAALNAEASFRTSLASIDRTGGLRLLEDTAAGSPRNQVQDETGRVIAIGGILNLIAVHPFARS